MKPEARLSIIGKNPNGSAKGVGKWASSRYAGPVTMRLPSGVIPLWAEVPVPVYVGDEASAPTSTTGALYSGTVTAGTNTVTITVAGMTATGTVVPILYNAPFSTTIRATCQSGSVLVTLGGLAPSNTTVKVKVESLA